MIKLNLGCGFDHKPQSEGWVNVDVDPKCNPDFTCSIEEIIKYSWIEYTDINEVLMKHSLEHCEPDIFFKLMKWIWERSINEATITIIVPHWQQEAAFDANHKWIYPPRTFKMLVDGSYKRYYEPAQFEIIELIEKDDAKEPQTKVVYKVIK